MAICEVFKSKHDRNNRLILLHSIGKLIFNPSHNPIHPWAFGNVTMILLPPTSNCEEVLTILRKGMAMK